VFVFSPVSVPLSSSSLSLPLFLSSYSSSFSVCQTWRAAFLDYYPWRQRALQKTFFRYPIDPPIGRATHLEEAVSTSFPPILSARLARMCLLPFRFVSFSRFISFLSFLFCSLLSLFLSFFLS
jgi:hypothetical protein